MGGVAQQGRAAGSRSNYGFADLGDDVVLERPGGTCRSWVQVPPPPPFLF